MYISSKLYSKEIILDKIDSRKTNMSKIANICQGLGDAFIMHKIIDISNFNFYCIHDAILCRVVDLEEIQQKILEAYRYVYKYYLNYKVIKEIMLNNIEYNINSLKIFDIK